MDVILADETFAFLPPQRSSSPIFQVQAWKVNQVFQPHSVCPSGMYGEIPEV